ncbi:hypothetical protein EST38_g5701 [Candolleomyces aberdarensis]|uniref:Uncharacterized protein n=1 Tax=Candolleomyces aberdarensis TaxID=2316362 RepID=A0A4Q2DLV7_9AGAR|nr:hypothetical protein EST38_g5701 [Candolleomyces aberdarensis]
MSTTAPALIEKALILGKWSSQISDASIPVVKIAKQVVDGDFRAVLTSPFAQKLFRPSAADFDRGLGEIFDFSNPLDESPTYDELYRLCIAIACLHAFVQANWTGPDLNITPLEVLSSETPGAATEQTLNRKAILELATGGEPAYHLAKHPAFLRFAQLILETSFTHVRTHVWWKLRTTQLHQRTLDEPVAHVLAYEDQLDSLASFVANDSHLHGRLLLERGLLHHLFSQDKFAAEYFVKAARSTGMEYELTGALGKRTKFQVKDLSQLVLLAESHLEEEPEEIKEKKASPAHETATSSDSGQDETIDGNTKMPETLALDDDTLLEQTEFTSSRPKDSTNPRLGHIDPSDQPALHPLDQCILLSLCLNVKNSMPAHGLTNEQMSPYVSRVISHPRNWSVHTMALLLRSRLESQRTRTVERSTFQLQALIDQMPTADSTLQERLAHFHSIPLPSKWEMEKELALRYMSLGVVKSGLEIFERLEMWEDVVQCYNSLSRADKGVSIVRDLLEGRKEEADAVLTRGKAGTAHRKELQDTTREAKLWCLLGDLEPENAEEHYQKAWSVSKESSGRAMRSLGGYYFAREKYPQAVASLKKAVAIHPLQSRPWFILGCASMRLEDWETARDAFGRCVAIDEEDGESWSNLASMYLRLDEGTEKDNVDEDDRRETQRVRLTMMTISHLNHDVTSGKIHQLQNEDQKTGSVPFSNKLRAFRALKQGLRYSYDNWRMWFNYMIVAMDVGELFEAARALGRVVEMTAEKVGANAVDEDVLERLVDAVTRASANAEEAQKEGGDQFDVSNPNEGHGLYKIVLDLFERTLLPRVSSPRIFRAYGRLLKWQSSAAGTMEKGETSVEKWRGAVSEVEDIVDILQNFGPRVEGFNKYKWRSQARSILRTFIARTKDFEDEPEWERLMALQEDLKKADED